MLETSSNAKFFLPFYSNQAVKPSTPLVGHSFSCTSILITRCFEALKVNPMVGFLYLCGNNFQEWETRIEKQVLTTNQTIL